MLLLPPLPPLQHPFDRAGKVAGGLARQVQLFMVATAATTCSGGFKLIQRLQPSG